MINQIKVHLLTFFDYVSAIPIAIYVTLLYHCTVNDNLTSFLLLIELLYVDCILVPFIKNQPYPPSLRCITDRPKNAQRCDYLSRETITKVKSGFPSGHMTITTMFSMYQICEKFMKENRFCYDKHLYVHILLVLCMGFARYYKSCHNITQIIAGIILGTVVGFLAFCLNNNL